LGFVTDRLKKLIDEKLYTNYIEVVMLLKILNQLYKIWISGGKVEEFNDMTYDYLTNNRLAQKNLIISSLNDKIFENLKNLKVVNDSKLLKLIQNKSIELFVAGDPENYTSKDIKKVTIAAFTENWKTKDIFTDEFADFINNTLKKEERVDLYGNITQLLISSNRNLSWDLIPNWKKRKEILEGLLEIKHNIPLAIENSTLESQQQLIIGVPPSTDDLEFLLSKFQPIRKSKQSSLKRKIPLIRIGNVTLTVLFNAGILKLGDEVEYKEYKGVIMFDGACSIADLINGKRNGRYFKSFEFIYFNLF
jgi:hypothetical protein